MRRMTVDMREALRRTVSDSAALAKNMTERAAALENEIRILQRRLLESEATIAAAKQQNAASVANANARAAAAEKEAEATRDKIKIIAAELDAAQKELARAKRLLAQKRPTYRDSSQHRAPSVVKKTQHGPGAAQDHAQPHRPPRGYPSP